MDVKESEPMNLTWFEVCTDPIVGDWQNAPFDTARIGNVYTPTAYQQLTIFHYIDRYNKSYWYYARYPMADFLRDIARSKRHLVVGVGENTWM